MWGEECAGSTLLRGEAPPQADSARPADAALHDLQSRLARDLDDALLLQQASTRLIEADDVDRVHEQLLDAAVSIMHADFGTVQVLDAALGVLRLLTSKGFEPGAVAAWAQVGTDSANACAAALRQGTRIVVRDVEDWAPLSGTAELEHMRQCGVRSVQSTPLRARDGRLVGMLSTQWRVPRVPTQRELRLFDVIARQAADLIERRRSEERLRESEVRLRLLIESVAQAVWETDAAGIVQLDSPSWRRYTGQSLQQWLGGGWIDAIHPEDRQFACRNWTESVRERRNVDAEFRLQHADGTWRWTNVKAMPLFGADGSVLKCIGMNIDVSERKNAELALRDVDRRKTEFLATLAHELRNPLAPLRHGIQISRLTGDHDSRRECCSAASTPSVAASRRSGRYCGSSGSMRRSTSSAITIGSCRSSRTRCPTRPSTPRPGRASWCTTSAPRTSP
jgi:PAS domain S-box-containing protein